MAFVYNATRHATEHALDCSSQSSEPEPDPEPLSSDEVDRESGYPSADSFAAVGEFSSYAPSTEEDSDSDFSAASTDEKGMNDEDNDVDFRGYNSCDSSDTRYSSTSAYTEAYDAAKNKEERAEVVKKHWRYFKEGDVMVSYTIDVVC